MRPFGQAAIARHGPASPQTYHIFMSHVHWDHIMGLPFFTPAYIPGNRIRIYGGHAVLEAALRRQQEPAVVSGGFLGAARRHRVHVPRAGPALRHRRHDASRPMLQRHAGDSYGYRFESGGEVVVYSTDSEHKLADPAETDAFVEFFRDADVVIFDAMYSLADAISVKADWGHSSNVVGVELCQMAGARHLCLFHHEPVQRRRSDRARARGNAPPRGDHAHRRSAARQRRLRRDGNRVVTLARGWRPPRAGSAASASSAIPRPASRSPR